MKLFSDDQLLLACIKKDILIKFNIINPFFEYNGTLFETNDSLLNWIERQRQEQRWVQYKRLRNNLFEIKDFSPNPSDDICNMLITTKINEFKKTFKAEFLYFKFEDLIYTEKQIHQKLLFELRDGYSDFLCFKEESLEKNYKHPICELEVYQEELSKELESGYLTLENTR